MIDVDYAEIMAELETHDPHCLFCDALMVTRAQWDRADMAERQELREEGYAEPRRRGLCRACESVTPEDQLPPPQGTGRTSDRAYVARMGAVVANRDELVAKGWTAEDACFWLGVDVATVNMAGRRLAKRVAA